MKKNVTILTVILASLCACNESSTPTDSDTLTTDTDSLTSENVNSPAPELTSLIYGIDISKYQGDEVELLDKSTDSLGFVICKGTEGNTYVDPDFETNWATIEEKGFIRGVYHFYRSDDDPETQSSNFLSILGDLDATNFSPMVDVEGGGIDASQSVETVQNDLLSFLQIIEEKTGRTPIIYTDVSEGDKYFSSDAFAKYPLWIADYSGEEEPRMPGVWANTEWTLWQKMDDYLIGSVENDFDVFNGSLVELQKFIKNY